MQGASPLASPALNRLRHLQTLPFRCPAGRCPVGRLPTLPLDCFFAPIPPPPFPAERGRVKVILCKGLRPLHPRHLTACGTYRACQAGTQCRGSPRLGAKSTEPPFYWRCRQPRRGGTGGEELRRLRWSSPPGLGEQVPLGVACLSPRLPTMPFVCRFSPISPTPFPSGEGGDQGYFMQGASPLASPALNRLRHLQTLPFRCSGASLPWNRARACVHENNREKFLGVWGLLSRSPQRFPVL